MYSRSVVQVHTLKPDRPVKAQHDAKQGLPLHEYGIRAAPRPLSTRRRHDGAQMPGLQLGVGRPCVPG